MAYSYRPTNLITLDHYMIIRVAELVKHWTTNLVVPASIPAGGGNLSIVKQVSYGVYISQLIRFARVSSHVDDFNTRNKVLTAKLLRQGYRYHKLRKAFSKFYRRHFDIVSD